MKDKYRTQLAHLRAKRKTALTEVDLKRIAAAEKFVQEALMRGEFSNKVDQAPDVSIFAGPVKRSSAS